MWERACPRLTKNKEQNIFNTLDTYLTYVYLTYIYKIDVKKK